MRLLFSALFLLSTQLTMAQSPKLTFSTNSDSKYERGIVKRMEAMLQQYDLSKWIFTEKVLVEDRVIPHSHPILTLSTRKQGDDELLSTFLHEQLHWHASDYDDKVDEAIADFKKIYPEVPVGRPDGARDEHSTYLHLIVCYLEFDALTAVIGKARATAVLENSNHYQWIYRQVLENTSELARIVEKNGLIL